jgi:hypothetical protein
MTAPNANCRRAIHKNCRTSQGRQFESVGLRNSLRTASGAEVKNFAP